MIYVGKIVNTFGIKGELKVASDFECAQDVFICNNDIFINNIVHKITKVRFHKNHYLIEIDNLNDINAVLVYKGSNIYIPRDILSLNEDDYLMDDLLDMNVYLNDNLVGKVTEVIKDKLNPLIKVDDNFYIPLKAKFIINVDRKSQRINTEGIEGLMI